jgi:hypothetical protein
MVLANVRDEQIAGLPMEGVRVAHAVGPDLGLRLGADLGELRLADAEQHHQPFPRGLREWVVVGDGVGAIGVFGHVDVDAQDLAQPRGQVLADLQGIALPAAVAGADV